MLIKGNGREEERENEEREEERDNLVLKPVEQLSRDQLTRAVEGRGMMYA